MRITLFVFFIVSFCSSALGQGNDWLIVPGKRLGPVTAQTSRSDLDRLFGKANVVDKGVDSGEGPEPATIVFPGDRSAALAIFWQGPLIDDVMVCYLNEAGPCKWHTQNGVTVGTSARRLETLNGRAFDFEPAGTDVAGNITSWRGGKLADLFGDSLKCRVRLAVNGSSPHPVVIRLRLIFRVTAGP